MMTPSSAILMCSPFEYQDDYCLVSSSVIASFARKYLWYLPRIKKGRKNFRKCSKEKKKLLNTKKKKYNLQFLILYIIINYLPSWIVLKWCNKWDLCVNFFWQTLQTCSTLFCTSWLCSCLLKLKFPGIILYYKIKHIHINYHRYYFLTCYS